MLPLHKQYEKYPLAARGIVHELDDVIDKVRVYHPKVYEEGSAGLARMFLDRDTKLFVAYAWATPKDRGRSLKWNYLIFKEGKEW